jgi:glycerol-3-phosphate dehydrogenase
MINVSDSQLITIAGGKWTTYRAMAAETVDEAVRVFGLKPKRPCLTETTRLLGAHEYSSTLFIRLIQKFGLETETARHLANSYGDRAFVVASYARPTGKSWPSIDERIAPGYPYIEAEVRYAVHHEYACTAVDVIGRRMRLAFLNARAAHQALPRIVEIMAEELGWDKKRCQKEIADGEHFLRYMGYTPETA